ncbi:pyridoxal-dependent decarboxylase, partial [Arthrobacter sp. JCM 19049]|uniref:pyridoxal phosphate-dependent decarboxylase family protein n=1 Tax=Arthrobacter sp. JCM 19049 TaxID=1460643 RepID=UPI000A85558B
PAQAPEEGDGGAGLLEDVQRIVMPGLTHWQHPSFFGFFPSNSELSSVLGDMLCTGLGVLGLSWESSPALSEIEQTVVDWTRQLFGLPEQFRGSIQDSASSSTLIALLCARERATDFALARGGLQAEEAPLIVYASRYAHSSVEKGALLAGFGRQNIHWIDTGQNHAMDQPH